MVSHAPKLAELAGEGQDEAGCPVVSHGVKSTGLTKFCSGEIAMPRKLEDEAIVPLEPHPTTTPQHQENNNKPS